MKSTALGGRRVFLALMTLIVGCGRSSENSVVGPDEGVTETQRGLVSAVTCPARLVGGLLLYNAMFRPGPLIPLNASHVSQGLGYWASRDWLITSHTLVPNVIAVTN